MLDPERLESLRKLVEGLPDSVLGRTVVLDGTEWVLLSRLGTTPYYQAIRRQEDPPVPVHVIEVPEEMLK